MTMKGLNGWEWEGMEETNRNINFGDENIRYKDNSKPLYMCGNWLKMNILSQ